MCISPISIINPNYGRDVKTGISRLFDCTNQYINIPCGHCYQCKNARQNKYIHRVQIESLDSAIYFFTLTYNDDHVPSINTPLFGNIRHINVSHVQNMFKRIRKHNPNLNFSYLVCPEYGTRRHRPHYHGLLSVRYPSYLHNTSSKQTFAYNIEQILFKTILKEWTVNVGTRKHPVYEQLCTPIFTPTHATYDLHLIKYDNPLLDPSDASFYVTKYVTKYDPWLEKFLYHIKCNTSLDEYEQYYQMIYPRPLMSKSFGAIDTPQRYNHIRKGIDLAKKLNFSYPLFVNPFNGKTSPLSRYYRKYLTVDDMDTILLNTQENADNHHDTALNTSYQTIIDYKDKAQHQNNFNLTQKKLAEKFA